MAAMRFNQEVFLIGVVDFGGLLLLSAVARAGFAALHLLAFAFVDLDLLAALDLLPLLEAEAVFFVLLAVLADGFFLAGVEALVFVFLSVMLFCDVDLELELERDDAADLRGGCVMKLLPKNRGAMITSWSEQS